MKLQTPYADVLPALSAAEMDALRQRVKDEDGIHDPVLVTEDGVVLDGHNRLRIDSDAKTKRLPGSKQWSDAQRRAFVIRCNRGRRNLSPDQDREVDKTSKKLAVELKGEGKTQKQIATIFGVSQQRVSQWLVKFTNTSPPSNGKSEKLPDCRIKVPPQAKAEIAARADAGVPQKTIAAELKISEPLVSKIVNAERKAADAKQERVAAAKKIEGDCGVIHGDFREHGSIVADASVDLILTDPPYDEQALDLYSDLATFAARVLRPGGWLLTYSGHAHLNRVLAALQSAAGLEYGWTFCCLHSGGDTRFRKFKLQVGWKPIFGFYREPLAVAWDWFKDVASGGKEKDLHEWQQAESEAAHFIERLSAKGAFVCDPFAGSATALSAAKNLGRRWIGFEVNEEHVQSARIRLNDAIT